MSETDASVSPGLRAVAVFHLADRTGPAESLRPRLEALVRDGGSLELIAPGEGSLRTSYNGRARHRYLPYSPLTVPAGPGAAASSLRRLRNEVRLFRAELRRARPDLVVVVTAVLPAALIAARLESLPTIVYVGELFGKGHVGGPVRALGGGAVARLTATLADRLVCCSEAVAAQFPAHEHKVVTIYPGISEAYRSGDGQGFRARHGLEAAQPLLAVVGNLSEARGQDIALRALAALSERVPEARLVLAGTPHPRAVDEAFAAGLRSLAEELGVAERVVFAGFVDRVADVYAAADVVVNPARFNEPFGRVAVEALMAGRPVVASAVGAIPEVLSDGRDALLVPRDDPGALADAVRRLVEDEELARSLVEEGGRRIRERFGEEHGVRAFERVVGDLLESARSPARANGR